MDDLIPHQAELDALARAVLEAARARGVMIATAESCTGGLIAGALTEIPGSSDVVDRGFVTYSYPSKQDLLGVRSESLRDHGAVSEIVAREMAEGALARSRAGLAVAVTGVAGPGASEAKPQGLVWFALAGQDKPTLSLQRRFAGDRRAVRLRTVHQALQLCLEHLERPASPDPA